MIDLSMPPPRSPDDPLERPRFVGEPAYLDSWLGHVSRLLRTRSRVVDFQGAPGSGSHVSRCRGHNAAGAETSQGQVRTES
jgi:hypothetical protein